MILTIITCTIRPAGAIEAARSIQAAAPHVFDLRHLIAYWPDAPDWTRQTVAPWLSGLIADVAHGWLMFVDDDNRLHPDLLARLGVLITEHPGARAFVFDCQYPEKHNGLLPASLRTIRPGMVDGGQVVLDVALAQSVPITAGDCYDGVWLQALYQICPDAFVCVSEPLTHHNHQVWGAPV